MIEHSAWFQQHVRCVYSMLVSSARLADEWSMEMQKFYFDGVLMARHNREGGGDKGDG